MQRRGDWRRQRGDERYSGGWGLCWEPGAIGAGIITTAVSRKADNRHNRDAIGIEQVRVGKRIHTTGERDVNVAAITRNLRIAYC